MHDISLASFSSSVFSVFIRLHWFIFFMLHLVLWGKSERAEVNQLWYILKWSITQTVWIRCVWVCIWDKWKIAVRKERKKERKKTPNPWVTWAEWEIRLASENGGGDVRQVHDLKQDKKPFKTEDPYNKSNAIYNQLRHTAGLHGSTKQVSTEEGQKINK